MSIHVFGIRHHGPGSARSVRRALEELAPDIVLVEGPPDAQSQLPMITHAAMKPPVALLVYASDSPSQAVFYPFATFSPEWQALSFALECGIPARFMDLPLSHQLKREEDREEEREGGEELHDDPLGILARAAGYTDRELWWEHQIEQRTDAGGMFEAILEAMTELRAHALFPAPHTREAQREAYMRKTLRAATKEGFQRIAVVCGAWHGPALVAASNAKTDDAILKGLPKTKTEATWIPWTYSRLSYRSGYGAGIASPGWYAHLWQSGGHPGQASFRWVTQIARLLRDAGIDAPSASVIETVRLADALASLRALSMPGLAELSDATLSVLCHGDAAPMNLIRTKLEIGESMGEVPEESAAVPLQRDLAAAQKRLRMKAIADSKPLELDLRNEHDRGKSRLLHRLNLLDIPWGQLQEVGAGKTGTFHEHWILAWDPELTLAVIEASIHGNTVESAATTKSAEDAREANLAGLTALLDATILSELPEATDRVLERLQERAALSADVFALMDAFPPLARAIRYGDVRQTRTEHLVSIANGLFERITVGLLPGCASLDDDAAARTREAIARVHESVALLDRADLAGEWTAVLQSLLGHIEIHGLLRGSACRLLLEQRTIDAPELERLARLALSPAIPPAAAASWVEGLLRGSALLLLSHDGLWDALDAWIASLSEEAFVEMLPLVRRGFSNFGAPERRRIGERVKNVGRGPQTRMSASTGPALDAGRAALVFPVLSQILGVEIP